MLPPGAAPPCAAASLLASYMCLVRPIHSSMETHNLEAMMGRLRMTHVWRGKVACKLSEGKLTPIVDLYRNV